MPLPVAVLALLAQMAASPVATPPSASRALTPDEAVQRVVDGRIRGRGGDTVVVAGRAAVGTGVLHPIRMRVWIQSPGAGLQLYGPAVHETIAVGDSVEARGVLARYDGAPELLVAEYRVVRGPAIPPAARAVPMLDSALQANRGRVATLDARIVGWGSDGSGLYAVLEDDAGGPRLALYVMAPIITELRIHEFGLGDRVRVTGPLIPFRPVDVSTVGRIRLRHRIIPRSRDDVVRIGSTHVTRRALRLAVPLALVVALLVACGAVYMLKREVRRKERRLRESEQRYRSLYELSIDAIAEYDLDGRLRTGNAALESRIGLPLQQLVGTPMEMSAPPEAAGAIGEMVAAVRRGETRRFETRLRGLDGRFNVVDLTLQPVVVDGAVIGYYAIGKDVTAEHETRAEVEAHARLLSAVVETQRVIAASELDVSAVARRILEQVTRLTSADLAELGFLEDGCIVVQPHMRSRDLGVPAVRLPLDGTLAGEAIRAGRAVRADDAALDPLVDAHARRALGVRSAIAVPLSYGGTTIGVLRVSSERPHAFGEGDERTLQLLAGLLAAALSHAREFEAKQELVAERTAALEQLQASEERFRSMIENGSDLMTVVGADGVIRWASPANARLLGWVPEEMAGRNAFDDVHPEDVAGVMAAFAEALSRPGGTGTAEYRYRHADGSWRTIASIGKNLLDDPALRGIIINSRDITEQRQLEEQLRHAQKMEAVGQLAGGVAHDFNNVLTVIRVHSAFLLEALADRDPRRVDAEEIQRASDRAAGLTRQLLAFSRRQILQPRVLDLNASITGVEPMLRRLIGEDITIVARLDARVGKITADAGQLEQVLMNLAVNARDAMPGGGTLTVTTADLRVDEGHPMAAELRPGRYASLAVTDTGVGMDTATRERVFEPFFTTKEQGKGTGLGLATVYGVVQQSGGAITVESEVGTGSTFRIYLPCVPEAAPEAEPSGAAPAAPERGTETILLVEDEDAVRSLARRILAARGYRIIEARNGKDALAAARAAAGEIHLVLTDVVMPEMGGRELAETISIERPETRVLFMSGYTDDDILRRGLHAPGVAFLHKPFTVRDLTEAVRNVLDGAVVSAA